MNEYLNKLDIFLTDLFTKKAPQLPKNAKDWLVKAMPWVILVFAVLTIPAILAALGVGVVVTPLVGDQVMTLGYWVGVTGSIVQIALELLAVPSLFRREMQGWSLLYYSALIGALIAVVNLSIIGFVGTIIELYILYQIKSQYQQAEAATK